MKYTALINRFNEPDVHLVVSAWPEEGVNHGIAWYTKLTLTAAAKQTGARFVVLAEQGKDNRPRLSVRGRVLVLRVFDKSHPSLYPTILTWLARFRRVTDVSVHSEFGVNAGLVHYLLLVPFLVLIKLTGRRLIYYAHNVITDISFLKRHLSLPEHYAVTDAINLIVRLHTIILGRLADRVVVLDAALARRLGTLVDEKKIISLPIPVKPQDRRTSKARAKASLGIPAGKRVVLAFGFVSAYKGTDWLMTAMDAAIKKSRSNDIHLVIAGGPAHSLADKPYYQIFYQALVRLAEKNPDITLTGFIPEREITRYFAAADLVVLPYRGLMGASGALTHALSYKKPFLVSEPMRAVVPKGTRVFTLDPRGVQTILRTVRSTKTLKRLRLLSAALANSRRIEEVTTQAYNALYVHHPTATPRGLVLSYTRI